MAIRNLRCMREGDSITVVWGWDMDQECAWISVTRLLDGEEVASKKVEQVLYQQAIHGPRHGPFLKVPPVPLHVTVRDGDNEESFDLVDKHYTVKWRLKKQEVYQRKGFFGGQKLERIDTWLELLFPYETPVPGDLFYYVLVGPGERPQDAAPAGYLPELRPGSNEYGVILPVGRRIELCCNPNRQQVSRLFDFKRESDVEQ